MTESGSDIHNDASEEPLIEVPHISGNEYIRKSQISNMDIRGMVVRCTSCLHQINHHDPDKVKKHVCLNVIVCNDCSEFYGSGEFSQDESGNYNYCAWCGNGGKLYLCDYCPNTFCSTCVRRNFGRAAVSEMSKEGWKCYMCQPEKLKAKVAFCDLILEYCKQKQDKKDKKTDSILAIKQNGTQNWTETHDWVLSAFDAANDTCKSFHKRLEKLRNIGMSQSKSLKHIIKKFEDIVNNHKGELNLVMKSLSRQYNSYLEAKKKCEEQREVKNNLDKTDLNKELNDDKHKINSLDVSADDKLNEEVLSGDGDKSKIIEDNYRAKLSLLNFSDSSLSGDELKVSNVESTEDKTDKDGTEDKTDKVGTEDKNGKVGTEDKTGNVGTEDKNGKVTTEDKTGKVTTEDKTTPLKEKEERKSEIPKTKDTLDINDENINISDSDMVKNVSMQEKEKKSDSDSSFKISFKNKAAKKSVSRKLFFNSASEEVASSESSIVLSSGSDGNKKSKMLRKKLVKSRPKIHKTLDYNDPKLKMKTSVVVEKCDKLLVNGETTVKIPEYLILEEMDKEIDALLREPKKKTFRDKMPKDPEKAPKKVKAPRKKKISESSSSICLTSSGEETEPNMKLSKFNKEVGGANTAAKNEILNSDLSIFSAESDEDSEPQKKKSKKKKVHSGSSDDFQPRKKKKYDKLLHKRLISDDDDDKDQKTSERKPPTKRRTVASDDSKSERKKSDSDTTTSDSEEFKLNKKKRRKRIKKVANSSSSDEKEKEDGASQSTPGKGRKNIKKILAKEDLTVETKEAQNIEKERRKRVQERQKLYNMITDTSADGNEIITRKMVLEIDPDSKEEIVEIHPDIVEKLKPHQVKGVKFMWECTIESVKRLEKEPGSGCILAHCMGLGKTLQVIAFLHTCLTNELVKKHIKTAMVICPYNTVLNWSREFDHWLKLVEGDEILVHGLTVAKDNYARLDILNYWKQDGGVLIISYDLFRRLASSKKINKLSSKSRNKILEHLIDPGPDIVICDEGHILKNVNSAISKACSLIASQRRIVLTGTPLQNNLLEYHCMLSFVKPHLLGTPKEFRNRFINPIMNGQYDDSNEYDVKRMKKRIHILHKLLGGCVQRCDYSALTKFLPPKHEFVISVKLSETQIKMYRWYLDNLSRAKTEEKIQGSSLFMDYNVLRNLCTHPFIVRRSFERLERRKFLKEDNESDFINDASEDSQSAPSKSDDSEAEEVVKIYKTRSRRNESGIESSEESNDGNEEKHWYDDFISDEDKHNIEISGKIILLVDILKECEAIGDKVIVFSQSLLTFDLLEDLLSFLDQQPVSEEDKQRDVQNSWSKNVDYFRMDGSTSAEFRKQYIDHFNDPANDRARLFLVSTKAGGLGTNLVGANRVIMLDASWNPSHDVQAIFRVYRFGQKKPVYIYRLLAQGTMEEKIYDRQVTKLSLSIRVVDEQQIDRHFNAAELAELYNFEPESQPNRPTPIVPKDTLLAEMLIKHTDWIVTYHEHDSLLQNETEEDLTEEERKAAWAEYENEREGRFVQNEEIPFDEDMNQFCKEPDFTEANYDGSLIPPVKTMIENIISRLKLKYPMSSTADLRKKLLTSLFGLRAVFQEKHLKILRMKQEYVAKGSVPVVVNKYLEELNGVVKNLTNHYENVSVMVAQDNKAAMHLQQQQSQQAQNPPRFIGTKPPFARYTMLPNRLSGVPYTQVRQQYIPRYGQFANANVAFNNMVAGMNFKQANPPWNHAQANAQAYATFAEALKHARKPVNIATSNDSRPQTVVTEVDKDESVSDNPKTNPHSTVVIEEIE